MASPHNEVLFVLSTATNLPLTGASGSMTFSTYADETGTPLSQPSITEIGGGLYSFPVTFSSTSHGVAYVLNITGGNPAYVWRYARNEDFYPDLIQDISKIEKGSWEIKQSGGDANKLIIYDADNTTVLYKFSLYDSNGAPTSINPYKRVPV